MDELLPEPGPPFVVGEHVRFAPTVFATPDDPTWFKWEEAIIVDVNYDAESIGFRFVSEPEGVRHAQGMEVIVRISASYLAWRGAYEAAYARTRDDQAASREASRLWLRVLAEHPIHGRDLERVPRKSKRS